MGEADIWDTCGKDTLAECWLSAWERSGACVVETSGVETGAEAKAGAGANTGARAEVAEDAGAGIDSGARAGGWKGAAAC
jgi:hypothetical protein